MRPEDEYALPGRKEVGRTQAKGTPRVRALTGGRTELEMERHAGAGVQCGPL